MEGPGGGGGIFPRLSQQEMFESGGAVCYNGKERKSAARPAGAGPDKGQVRDGRNETVYRGSGGRRG